LRKEDKMHKLYELKDKLMSELEDYAENGKFSKDDVEAIKYTASAIDHICNICSDEEGYSGDMMGGTYPATRRGYTTGRSYRRGGRTGRNQYGSYAYSRAAEGISEDLKRLAEDAPDEETKSEIHRLAKKLENM
jgi:hypothetical protein